MIMKTPDRKQRLTSLGAERLADVLLELAAHNDLADDMVERMIATPQENIERFKAKLAAIKRSRRFIGWGESGAYARELVGLLEYLRVGVDDPRTGAELVAAFYLSDNGILRNCDDSSGHVGDVFRHDACELFVSYARRCDDKRLLGDLLYKVSRADDYGIRDTLVACAAEYLPETVLRSLVARFQKQAAGQDDEYAKRHWLHLVELLARQLKDAPLFEQTRIAAWGGESTASCIDIARVYLESGDAPTALAWLEKIPESESFMAVERDELLLEVYGRLGNVTRQTGVAWRIFRRSRSLPALERLLTVIGPDQQAAVLEGEAAAIMAGGRFSSADAAFLLAIGRSAETEDYLFRHVEQIDGGQYNWLVPLAEALEKNGRYPGASLLYRALLDSILLRAQTKTYGHGARYLRKLDRLAAQVTDWRTLDPHSVYRERLIQDHRRKSSFWARFGDQP